MTIALIAAFVLIIIMLIIPQATKRIVYKKLTQYLGNHEYEAFEKLLDGFACTFSFRPYNREYMRLTSCFMQGDTKKIEAQLDQMFKRLKMKDNQKASLAKRGFYFYMENHNDNKAKKMLSILQNCEGNESEVHNAQMMYDILVEHKSDYITEMKERLHVAKKQYQTSNKSAELVRIGVFEYMLALQYRNQGNKKTSRDYLESALKHCQNTPYEKEINTLLKKG